MLERVSNFARPWMIPAVLAGMMIGPTQTASGQCEIDELLASDGEAYDEFGVSVAIDGDTLIVGAYHDDDDGSRSGSAYIFRHNGSSWVEETKLTASDASANDDFGVSVDISGSLVIIGARGNDQDGIRFGAAYIFSRDEETGEWVEQQKLVASDGAENDNFGEAVAMSGDAAVVGAPRNDQNGSNAGAAYVFRTTDGGRSWIEQTKLLAADGSAIDQFGDAVDIEGDRILVGAYRNDVIDTASGSAYIFRHDPRVAGEWIEEIRLVPLDGQSWDNFGRHVAIDGEVCVVGATGDDDNGSSAGSAYIFRYDIDTSQWIEEAKLLASDGMELDFFGTVAIEGNVAVVGADRHDLPAENAGAAYVFERGDETSTWSEQGKILASDNAANDRFGGAVAIDGGLVIAGATSHDDLGSSSGSAYVFDALAETDANNNGIPDACEPAFGDLNSDGVVGAADLVILLAFWGPCPPPPLECLGDLNADQVVGAADLLILLANWS